MSIGRIEMDGKTTWVVCGASFTGLVPGETSIGISPFMVDVGRAILAMGLPVHDGPMEWSPSVFGPKMPLHLVGAIGLEW